VKLLDMYISANLILLLNTPVDTGQYKCQILHYPLIH